MLHLPAELVLQVLSYIPIPQISYLRLSSRAWNSFIAKNESSVYHAAAILHDFAPPQRSLEECKASNTATWAEEISSWKEFCRMTYMMEMRWVGRLPARHHRISPNQDIHRFKIDEHQNAFITTHTTGGLDVTSVDNHELLWSLSKATVREYAHCEYSGGFLIFDRIGRTLEIWRRKRDSRENPLVASPDVLQERSHRSAFQSESSISQDNRGAFVPFTIITPPNDARAYRFIYPTLLVVSEDAQEAYLFDVPTGQLTQTLSITVNPHYNISIEYVDLSARHIFVCTEDEGLFIFSCTTDHEPTYMQFNPAMIPDCSELCRDRIYKNECDNEHFQDSISTKLRECYLQQGDQLVGDMFVGDGALSAVHVSPCGSHLVCVGLGGFLVIIRDFERALRDTVSLPSCITVIFMDAPIIQMAFEEDRVAFYAVQKGLFVVPHATQQRLSIGSLTESSEDFQPRLLQAYVGIAPDGLDFTDYCSCVQIHRTAVWYVAGQPMDNEEGEELLWKPLRCIDFAHPPADRHDKDSDVEVVD